MFMLAVLGALACLQVEVGYSASDPDVEALRKEIEALKSQQVAVQKQLEELTTLLKGQAQAAPPPTRLEAVGAVLDVDGSPFLGRKDAPITLVEFFDYECPFCMRHVQQTLPQIQRDYIDSGKVKYVVRDFPIDALHPNSFKKHEAAHCAGDQGKYWDMRARLLSGAKEARTDDFSTDGRALGLKSSDFGQCLTSGVHAVDVRTDIAEGNKAGVFGSPTFFVGMTEPNKATVTVMRVVRGAQPYQTFKDAIDALLQPPTAKN